MFIAIIRPYRNAGKMVEHGRVDIIMHQIRMIEHINRTKMVR